jgi:magnesium transporter
MLSDAEEAEMDRARQSGFRGDHDGQSEDGHGPAHYHVEEEERADHAVESVGGSSGYDSHARLLRRRGSDEDSGSHRLRMEHRHPGPHQGPTRNVFDFGAMEDFAKRERDVGPGDRPEVYIPNGRGDLAANDQGNAIPSSYDTVMDRTNPMSAFGDDHETAFSPKEAELGSSQQGFHRRRQRKLSQSNPVHRRQGKLALFEGFGSQGAAAENETGEGGQPFKAARQPKHLGPNGNGFATYTDAAPGHDRPYRFSFYSNALPVTIHARSLAELPAEGQTFEDLFKGRNEGMEDDRPSNPEGTDYGSIRTTPRETESTTPTGQESAGQGAKLSMLARAAGAASKGNGAGGGPPNGTAEEDPEAFTFWLDVLSPTDEEMRMLSKVSRVIGHH